jgi:tetratricopeptide (TPR) repeat protein
MADDSGRKYDPNVVIRLANEKLAANDVEGGQLVFQSALLDWVDDAREGSASLDSESLREAVGTLWLAYAHYLTEANQFKSASEAYDQAISCPVAGSLGRIYLDFARFAEDRQRLKKAQDIYMKALVGKDGQASAVTDEQDRHLLWQEFLEMMRKSNPQLTLLDLQQAAESERQVQSLITTDAPETDPSADLYDIDPSLQMTSLHEPLSKRLKTGYDAGDGLQMPPPTQILQSSKTHVVTAESMETEASALVDTLQQSALPPDITAAWMIKDGNGPAVPPTPPLFDPSPPKLSDPTGKDILGLEMAVKLNRRLLESSGSLLLEVSRALWTLTALKEKECKTSLDTLDEDMLKEHERLEASLDARVSVAGAALSAVQQMNSNERNNFQVTCSQRRQNALSASAWEFRQLLCLQQQVLSKLRIPGFDGPTVDASALKLQSQICMYLHSAFYLRKRIGDAPHVSMLEKQAIRLDKELEQMLQEEQHHQDQQFGGGSNLPLPPPPPPPQTGNAYDYSYQQQPMAGLPPPPQQQQQGYIYPGQPVQGQALPQHLHQYGNQPHYPSYYQ